MTDLLDTALDSVEVPKRPIGSPCPSPKPSKISRSEGEVGAEEEEDCGRDQVSRRMSQNPRIQRYLVAVEYIGTRFSGSQRQPNRRTVVGVLEDAFQKFVGQPVSIIFSSRTDAGVHALSNVCHVDVERISKRKPGEVLQPHEPGVVRRAVNHFLQKDEGDITVIDVRCIPADFHARFKAQERTYFYRLLCGPEPLSVFEKERAWHMPEVLDVHAMQKACNILVGFHDFSSFRASGCQANSPIKILDELHVSEVVPFPYFPSIAEREKMNSFREPPACSNNEESGPPSQGPSARLQHSGKCSFNSVQEFGQREGHRCYVITARARSFLYHQVTACPSGQFFVVDGTRFEGVRLLVGVLKAVGSGELTENDVERILNAKTVTAASPMAPACGLYLGQVKYNLP